MSVILVLLLSIAVVASYPSYQEAEDDQDLELEVRSILKHLENEQMERSVASGTSPFITIKSKFIALDEDDDDDDDDEYEMSKRQGGNNIVDKQSKCEIQCIYEQRNPKVGKGKTVKDAAKVCKQRCPNLNKKRDDKKKLNVRKPAGNNMGLREFNDDDDQQFDRRELYNYLMEQLDQDTD